jgi:predicted nuclease of predicted toxin-antitoxin system
MLRVELATLLRDAAHDVVRASETGQARADDALILERAVQEQRTLITLDGHFGVIRVKTHPTSTENVFKVLLPLLANHMQTDFRNKLVIASLSRVRWIQTKDE